jgi:membrane-associated phospholipid phosphatase
VSRRERDPYAGYDPFALRVFVPAVMSAGLLFSLLTLVRDGLAGRRHRGERRRVGVAAAAVAADVLREEPDPSLRGLRPRRFYLVVGLALAAAACYLVPGALLNYAHDGGYVSDIAWLLSTSVLVAVLAAGTAALALATWWRWPEPPPVARRTLAATPLAGEPERLVAGGGGDPALGAAAFVGAVSFVALAVGVGAARTGFARFDRSALDVVVGWDLPSVVDASAALGSTEVALALALLVGVATMRCRPLAIAWVVAVTGSFVVDAAVKTMIERPRPPGSAVTAIDDSFPSGHVVQATLLAVVVPLALFELTGRRWPARLAGALLACGAAMAALERVHQGTHWPTDVLGGALLGLAAGLGVWWARSHRSWHGRCHGCSMSGPAAEVRRRAPGIIRLSGRSARRLRRLGTAGLLIAIAGLLVVARTRGLPSDPEGEGMLSDVEGPAQLGLLGIALLGGLLARRFPAIGMTLVVVAASGLGLLASIEHPPWVAIAVTVVIGAPGVLLWLAWQHREGHLRVAVVALVAVTAITVQAVAAARIHDHFFGPAHPESPTAAIPVDQVEWAWSGDLRPDGATVVARLAADRGGTEVALLVAEGRGPQRQVAATTTDGDGIARLVARDLRADADHTWTVAVEGVADRGRGVGRFRTAPPGPASFTLTAGSCARTASDGAVYDAIRAERPLLHLVTGDIHYRNLDATTTGPFLAAFGQVLTSPAQAALYREVPVDYVWDDHDYGPNDADASSPGRDAARAAYRQAVPHPPLPDDGPIFHASTVGRVRIVMTDTRSERTDRTMLGEEQLAWLLTELAAAGRYGLVIWVNPDPWIAPEGPGRDDWGGYAAERRTIADAIAAAGVDNLVMVSGDAHMVAIDDGTNSDFSTSGGAGFPVLHAAALDRPGNVKGGPYSEGAFPGGGQYGVVRIEDDGTSVRVELEGRDWSGRLLVSHTFVAT